MKPCFYCGGPMQRANRRGRRSKLERTADHLTPKCLGGHRMIFDATGGMTSNIVYCHRKCNEDKGDRTLEEYRAIMAARKGIAIEEFKFPGELRES